MHTGEIEGKPYKEFDYDFVSVETSHVKRYNNALMLLMGISGVEVHLMEWITGNMTEGNFIMNNEVTRSSFIAFYEKHKKSGNKSYSDHSVKKAFWNLSGSGLLIPKVRGVFIVNPMYYYKGADEERLKSIRLTMEFAEGMETKINVEVKK